MITKRSRVKTVALLSALTVALSAALIAEPAQAYYYPFNYYGGGGARGIGNLLYPLSYLAYPLLYGGGRGPVSAYSTPMLIRQTSRALTGSYNFPYGPYANVYNGYPYMNGPYGMQNYSDEEPLTAPRKRKRPKRVGQYGVDQVAHAEWLDPSESDAQLLQHMPPDAASQYSNLQNQLAGRIPPVNQPPQPPSQFSQPPQSAPQYSQAPPSRTTQNSNQPLQPSLSATAFGAPPLAPSVAGGQPVSLAPSRNSANPAAPVGAPLAEGFVNHVNNKYGGNIKNALFDSETRSYARVIGLVNDDNLFQANLSDARVALVKQILQDGSLDPVSKLQAIKIMIGGNR